MTQINLPHYIPRSKRTPALHLEATLAIMVSFQEKYDLDAHKPLCWAQQQYPACQDALSGAGEGLKTETSDLENDLFSE